MRAAVRFALVLIVAATGVTGCTRPSEPVIERVDEAAESTSTITPLQRGAYRREVLKHVREFTAAWQDSDAKKMRSMLPEDAVKPFTKVWDDYAEDGLSVAHEHEVVTLDVTEFNKTATQATVSYAFKDTSHLVDEQGRTVRELEPLDSSLTITVERDEGSDTWRIVRMFMKADGYR